MRRVLGIALVILVLAVMAACNNKETSNQAKAPTAKQGDEVDTASPVSGVEVFQKKLYHLPQHRRHYGGTNKH